jgi:hypothetical protein
VCLRTSFMQTHHKLAALSDLVIALPAAFVVVGRPTAS